MKIKNRRIVATFVYFLVSLIFPFLRISFTSFTLIIISLLLLRGCIACSISDHWLHCIRLLLHQCINLLEYKKVELQYTR